jgi:hypothetical protein
MYTKNVKCFVWDLGLDEMSISNLHSFHDNKIEYRKFDYFKYNDYYNIEIEAGQYAWKPAIIRETMNELLLSNTKKDDPLILFWCDSGNILNPMTIPYLEDIVSKNKLYSPTSSGNIKYWTHPGTLHYFNIHENDPLLMKENRNGAQFGFLISDKKVQEFIRHFDACAHIKDCIAPQGSSRQNHRQDQAVFSILYYKFFELYSQYGQINVSICKIQQDID